jgi:hypothetical protein
VGEPEDNNAAKQEGAPMTTIRQQGAASASRLALMIVLGGTLGAAAMPAAARDAAPSADTPAADTTAADAQAAPAAQAPAGGGRQLDVFSKDVFTVLLDGRMVVADGSRSFVKKGFGITRWQGNDKGDFTPQITPVEADLIWTPRFTSSLNANISVSWQRDHNPGVGVMEAFINYYPAETGTFSVSARAGLMWPEISLEHSTGGAWSVVNTITPSAINSWVGEEVRVVGAEGTVHANLNQHLLSFTAAVFGWNDTSGTLLSYRGWALSDIKGTAPGYYPLPPFNPFIAQIQQNQTQNTLNIDHRPGFYTRIDWRPPLPFGVAAFYYDNNGNPKAFTAAGQWGWRTRFGNLGINADLDASGNTRLIAQGMIGSTQMGFKSNGRLWVDTDYESAFVLVSHNFGPFAAATRVEAFRTREHGSEMPPDNDQDGWAWTTAIRKNLTDHLTVYGEALNVHSWRGTRVSLGGLNSPFESQTVLQIALRYRL